MPHVPVRQWVLSVPVELRYRMAFDATLCSKVLDCMIHQVRRHLRLRAKRLYGLDSVKWLQTGSVTFIQRADSGLRLNVHFHSLFLDRVYQIRGPLQARIFLEFRAPSEAGVQQVALAIRRRVLAILGKASEFDGAAFRPGRYSRGHWATVGWSRDDENGSTRATHRSAQRSVTTVVRRSCLGNSANSLDARSRRPSNYRCVSCCSNRSQWTVGDICVRLSLER